MLSQIHKILNPEQVETAINALLSGANSSIKILRTIAKTGKYGQANPWVYWQCEVTGKKVATFLSTKNLLSAFWSWLETVEVMLLAAWEQIVISTAIWNIAQLGDWAYHKTYGKVQIVEKTSAGDGSRHLWIRYNQTSITVDPIKLYYIIP